MVDSRVARIGFTFAMSSLLPGCLSYAQYEPRVPIVREGAGGTVEPVLVEDHGGFADVTLRTRFPSGTWLYGAYYTPENPTLREYAFEEEEHPVGCAGNVAPLQIIDGRERWSERDGDISGTHEVVLSRGRAWDWVGLDVQRSGVRECIPVHLGWTRGWSRRGPWEVGVAFGGHGVVDEGLDDLFGLRLQLRRWDRWWRFGVEVGIANAESCNEPPCDNPYVFPASLEADAFKAVGELGFAGVLVGGGARAMFVLLPSGDDDRERGSWTWLASPQIGAASLAYFGFPADRDPQADDLRHNGLLLGLWFGGGPAFGTALRDGDVTPMVTLLLSVGTTR